MSTTAEKFSPIGQNGFYGNKLEYKLDAPKSNRATNIGVKRNESFPNSKLEEQFNAACEAIQSLPKNG